MDRRIVWSPSALEDLEAIATYIARDSTVHARQVIDRIWQAGQELVEFPLAWRKVPEARDPNVRERFVYSYRLIYRIEGDILRVLAVVHGRRSLGGLADRFEEAQTDFVVA